MRENSKHRVVTMAVVVLLAAACTGQRDRPIGGSTASSTSVASASDTLPAVANSPELPASTEVPTIPNEGSADVLRQQWTYQRAGPPGPLVVANGVPPVLLAAGFHTTDVLGIEATVALDDWWRLDAEDPGSFSLTRPGTPIGELLPLVIFVRPLGLVEPSRVHDENLLPGEALVPPADLGAWLGDVDQIEVLATGRASAGDRTGTWFDVEVEPDAGPTMSNCVPGRCVHTWWAGSSVSFNARDLESIRYYEFPDPAGPIYVVVVAAHDEWDEWIERADNLVRTTRFGPSASHPVAEVSLASFRGHAEGEPVRFVEFPGLVITPETRSLVIQWPGYLAFHRWRSGCCPVRAVIVRPVQTSDGTPLGSVSDIAIALAAAGMSRGDDELIAGVTAAVFKGEVAQPLLRFGEVADGHDPDFVEWPEPSLVQAWVFDSPLGPLVLAAQSDSESRFDEAVERARILSDAMSFDS